MNYILLALALAFSKDTFTLGPVTEEMERSNGGCSLQVPHEFAKRDGSFIFVSNFDGQAIVNVDGSDIHLTLVKSQGPDVKRRGELGEHSTYSYTGADIDVEVDYLVSEGCPINKSCTTTRYDAILTVKRGKAHKSVAAKAVCGS